MATTAIATPKVVSREQWLASRKQLLSAEKELTRLRDELSRERRELPWVKVDKNYVFDSPGGKVTLADLFAGRTQLVIYHFMFGPEWAAGCPSCSMVADQFDGNLTPLANRDVTLLAVSRAPISKIEEFKKRMGWRFRWVSSFANDFNRDFRVSFTQDEIASGKKNYNFETFAFTVEEAPGLSVFYKDADGNIFHTYSTFGRGLEPLLVNYTVLDLVPKGRDEASLPSPMSWVRHHDRYEQSYFADAKSEQPPANSATHGCCSSNSNSKS